MKTYYLKPEPGSEKRVYVAYLVKRLTEFRKAGASWGQSFGGQVSEQVVTRIAQKELGNIFDESRFEEVCAYFKAKIDGTILGKRNTGMGRRNYHEFQDSNTQNEADAVPAYPGKRESRETVQDSGGDGRRGEGEPQGSESSLPPLTAGSNPRIAGAELTNQPEVVEGAPSPVPGGECGQETTYQQLEESNRTLGSVEAEEGGLRERHDRNLLPRHPQRSLSQAKEKSDGSGTGSTAEFMRPVIDGERSDFMVRTDRSDRTNREWFIAADIARALKRHKKWVHRLAQRQGWPCRQNQNRLEYQPPREITEVVVAAPAGGDLGEGVKVRFADLVAGDWQRAAVLLRERAVAMLGNNLHLGKEVALKLVCAHMAQNWMNEVPGLPSDFVFRISVSSLRRWEESYGKYGIDGLVEQKRGRVGRKAFALDLDTEALLQTAANAVEYGSAKKGTQRGRLNVARAYRDLVANPTVNGAAREWLHGDHASKSYVPPSVREAVKARISPLGTTLIQIGPKAARLDGPYTECSYDGVAAGRAWTADDMTANVYVWLPWPNEQGWLLIRPQILAILDIGSLCWRNVRGVVRPKGQYTKDDVWGLIGDGLDEYGLHLGQDGQVDEIAVLEGGTWQSDVVIGAKSGMDDEARCGGLRSLGVKVIHTRSPRGKAIEQAFNTLQHAADNCRGFCGREEMKDCPEHVRQELALCRAGKAHPRQFFMQFGEYVEHLSAVMKALNHERNDGKIVRGATPAEKWAEEIGAGYQPKFRVFPDESKWLYRAAFRVKQVTRNGVHITAGTGKFQMGYTYYHPALEHVKGSRVWVWWNDTNPDTDAVIYSIRGGKPHRLICVAPRVPNPNRFGASDMEMEREGARKKMAMQLAVSQSKSLAPYLQRSQRAEVSGQREDVGRELAAAKERAETQARDQRVAERMKSRLVEGAEDISELRSETTRPTAPEAAISLEELNEL